MSTLALPRPEDCGLVAMETWRGASGLDILRGMIAGKYPPPPIAGLFGFTLIEAEPGLAVFAGVPEVRHYNPFGAVHGGYTGVLLDSCMTCAIQTLLEVGYGCVTLEYKVNMVAPITAETGPVRAEGRVIHPGKRNPTAEGRLLDAKGRLLSHGTTTCTVFKV